MTRTEAADHVLAWVLWHVEDRAPQMGEEHLRMARLIRQTLKERGHVIVEMPPADASRPRVDVALTVPGECDLHLTINGEDLLLPT